MPRIVFLSLLVPLAACQPGSEPKNFNELFSSLESAQSTNNQAAWLEKARAADTKGEYKLASEWYRLALNAQPDNKDISLALADCYRRGDDVDSALKIYDALLAQDAMNLAALEGKALALMVKGDFNAPPNLFDQVMKQDPTRWKTLNGLGILFATRNLYSEAGQYFQEALKYSPSNPTVVSNLALSQALTKNYDLAVSNLNQASSFAAADSADRKRIDMNLALVYAAMGKLNDAQSLTARYYTGPALENNMDVYAHVANDKPLADNYLNMALTENRAFYERALSKMQTAPAPLSQSFSIISPAAGGEPPPAATLSTEPTVGAVPATPPVASTVVPEKMSSPPESVSISTPAKPAKPEKPKATAKLPAKPKTAKVVKAPLPPKDIKPDPKQITVAEDRKELKTESDSVIIRVEQPKPDPMKNLSGDDKALATIVGAGD
jgi:Flp pilus assembly protein TadD